MCVYFTSVTDVVELLKEEERAKCVWYVLLKTHYHNICNNYMQIIFNTCLPTCSGHKHNLINTEQLLVKNLLKLINLMLLNSIYFVLC